MLLIAISSVTNELDILETWVRYYAGIADRMILLPHRSDPQVYTILESLQKEGLPIDIWPHTNVYYDEANALTQSVRRAAALYNAEWILPTSVDEFIAPAESGEGHEGIRRHIAASDSSGIQLLPWRTYIPDAADSPGSHLLEKIHRRRQSESPQFHRAMMPGHLAADVLVPNGSHTILHADGTTYPQQEHGTLCSAHFPVRTTVQLMNKALRSWPALLASPSAKEGEGYQWKRIFDICREQGSITQQQLHEMAIHYVSLAEEMASDVPLVDDPLSCPPAVTQQRYAVHEPSPVRILADLAEDLAHIVGTMKKND